MKKRNISCMTTWEGVMFDMVKFMRRVDAVFLVLVIGCIANGFIQTGCSKEEKNFECDNPVVELSENGSTTETPTVELIEFTVDWADGTTTTATSEPGETLEYTYEVTPPWDSDDPAIVSESRKIESR